MQMLPGSLNELIGDANLMDCHELWSEDNQDILKEKNHVRDFPQWSSS